MSKILIVYFSHNKENYFSGNIVNLEKGNVQVIAEALSTMIDADIYQIKEVDEYPFENHSFYFPPNPLSNCCLHPST